MRLSLPCSHAGNSSSNFKLLNNLLRTKLCNGFFLTLALSRGKRIENMTPFKRCYDAMNTLRWYTTIFNNIQLMDKVTVAQSPFSTQWYYYIFRERYPSGSRNTLHDLLLHCFYTGWIIIFVHIIKFCDTDNQSTITKCS